MINNTFKKTGLSLICASILAATGCSDDDNDTPDTGGTTPAVPGQFIINASGGLGGSDTGGLGGVAQDIEVYKYGKGDLIVSNEGEADASFTPSTATGNTGDTPLVISANTSIVNLVVTDPRPTTVDAPYTIGTSNVIYLSPGSGNVAGGGDPADGDVVTGIEVTSGFTLTVALNQTTEAEISVDNDIINNGTITTEDISTTQTGNLRLIVASYIGSGAIDTSGTLSADEQDGGDIRIDSDYGIYNNSTLNTSGSDGDASNSAGNGGDVYLYAGTRLENTAAITTDGGDSVNTGFGGGDAGQVYLEGQWGDMHNNATISSTGGDGASFGGDGAYVWLYADSTGDLINSGDVTTTGGNATEGTAGNGGEIEIEDDGGRLIFNADLTTTGGSTTDNASNGGSGGYIYFYNYDTSFYNANDDQPGGDMLISGTMNLKGGDAVSTGTGDGGSAGQFYVEQENDDQDDVEKVIHLLGYTDMIARGGDGYNAGQGEDYYLGHYESNNGETEGNTENHANVDLRGGDSSATALVGQQADDGGNVSIETPYYDGNSSPDDSHLAINTGDINTSGGNGSLNLTSNTTTRSGSVYIWGYNGASNSGDITQNGGNDVAADGDGTTSGYGGYANDVEIYADNGIASNSGAISVNGGDAEYDAGYSNGVYTYGQEATNSGNISANGGNADITVTGSRGGNAGWVELASPHNAVSNTGTVTNTGGTGEATTGNDGAVVVGDICTGNC